MVAINKSVYKFAKNDIVKREFYNRTIKQCYYNPNIDIKNTDDKCEIFVKSDAKNDFYLFMKKLDKTNKNIAIYDKYTNNINAITTFIKNYSNSQYDLAVNEYLDYSFESHKDMIQSMNFIDGVEKYFDIANNYTFGVETETNEIFLFSCSLDKITNCGYYPLFDIDDGFRDLFGNLENNDFLNYYFEKWKNNNYDGSIFQ